MQLHCVEKSLKSSPKVVILAHRFFAIFKCLILRIFLNITEENMMTMKEGTKAGLCCRT